MNPDEWQCEMCNEIMTACDFMCSDICSERLKGEG